MDNLQSKFFLIDLIDSSIHKHCLLIIFNISLWVNKLDNLSLPSLLLITGPLFIVLLLVILLEFIN